jgi:GNAT superfamily N-acetyltransferase
MSSAARQIEAAIETFVRGFCAGKSRTHPYLAEFVEGVWTMRDGPRRNPRDYRKEEWIAYGVPPAKVDAIARRHTRGRFFVCAVIESGESDEPLRAEYKRLGYRLLEREGLFWHSLRRIPGADSPATIERVRTQARADQLGKATRSRPIPAEQLADVAKFRQYVALENDVTIGWVRSTAVGDSTWVSDRYVLPTHRRRGIGMAMLAKMLRDDRRYGAQQSVLLSSKAGALLYPVVGYKQIGTLFIFAPKKS